MPRRIFRALVRLLPEEFRAGYAREMESTFDAELQHARTAGRPLAIPRLWLATITDLLKTAPGEHLDILIRDVRFALRTMAARPTHSLTALVTLALGIGANIAMFAVIDGVLLAPLPYPNPDALVWIGETEDGGEPATVGYLSFVDLRERSRSFESLIAVSQSTATLTGDGKEAERVNSMRVSSAYFDLVGTRPILGRAFTEAEDRAGPERRVVVLSDALWRRRFDADPSVVGRIIEISGVPYTAIGVMPPGFTDLIAERLYQGAEVWVPLGYDPAASFACRTCRHLRVFGRLAPGRSVDAAQTELSGIVTALENEHPTEYHQAGISVTSLSEMFLGPVKPVLLALWAGVAVLLLVACSNVASLLLLRASERTHEIAVRGALGVTRGRMARQLLTESVLLAALGGLAAWLPAWAAVRLLTLSAPSDLPRLADVSIDARVVGVALFITTISGVVFGLAPLRHLLRRHSAGTMQGAGRRTDSAATWRVRSALVAVNVAMAAVLLVGSGLLVRSLTSLLAVSPGVDPRGVVTMQIWASGRRFAVDGPTAQIAEAVGFYESVLTRVRALPGVTSAAAVTTLPLGGSRDGHSLYIEGRPPANPAEAPGGDRFVVTPDYFATLRIPLVRGRLIDERDQQGRESVMVINWPSRPPWSSGRSAAQGRGGCEDARTGRAGAGAGLRAARAVGVGRDVPDAGRPGGVESGVARDADSRDREDDRSGAADHEGPPL